jgi:hypothetical protein
MIIGNHEEKRRKKKNKGYKKKKKREAEKQQNATWHAQYAKARTALSEVFPLLKEKKKENSSNLDQG